MVVCVIIINLYECWYIKNLIVYVFENVISNKLWVFKKNRNNIFNE